MQAKILAFVLILAVATGSLSLIPYAPVPLGPETSLAEVLEKLGDEPLPHKPDFSLEGVSAEKGAAIVQKGIAAKPGGGRTGKQSKHFVCTSCHNIQKEDPDLSRSDPQARLEYAAKKGIPFLPGTTLYGVVNRTSFYNGDYEEKYGDLVVAARNDLREAIQLCAVECSQGRLLEDWELESVLAYLWTIDLKLSDIPLTEEAFAELQKALKGNGDQERQIAWLKTKYLSGAPATFVKPPEDRKTGYAYEGDPENGKLVYDLSCKHCHEKQRYSFFELDDSNYSFRFLEKHIPKYTRYSIYQVIRYGTQPLPGKKAYMPNFTLEKLSDQQVEDLRAYIEQQAQ